MKVSPDIFTVSVLDRDPLDHIIPTISTQPVVTVTWLEFYSEHQPLNQFHATNLERGATQFREPAYIPNIGIVNKIITYVPQTVSAPRFIAPLTPLTAEAVGRTFGIENIVSTPLIRPPKPTEIQRIAQRHHCLNFLDQVSFYRIGIDGDNDIMAHAITLLPLPQDQSYTLKCDPLEVKVPTHDTEWGTLPVIQQFTQNADFFAEIKKGIPQSWQDCAIDAMKGYSRRQQEALDNDENPQDVPVLYFWPRRPENAVFTHALRTAQLIRMETVGPAH